MPSLMLAERWRLFVAARTHAKHHYDPNRPYHNWRHATTAEQDGAALVECCLADGIPADSLVVSIALYFHDAEHHRDHTACGYATKEALAADIMRQEMAQAGAPVWLLDAAASCILATHRDAVCATNEEKVVRAADLAGLAKPYETFLENNVRLKREAEEDGRAPITWRAWKTGTEQVVEFYLSQDIRLTRRHDDARGASRFHAAARANLERFLAEDATTLEERYRSLFPAPVPA